MTLIDTLAGIEEEPAIDNSLKLVMPLPPIGCSPNTHRHWRYKAAAVKKYRSDCFLMAKSQYGGATIATRVRLSFDWYMAKQFSNVYDGLYRPKDTDNAIAAIKPLIDGLRDAGILADDNHQHVEIGRVNLYRTKASHKGRLMIEITLKPELYPMQREAIFNEKRYSLIEASTKSGKTTGCLQWIVERALSYNRWREYHLSNESGC